MTTELQEAPAPVLAEGDGDGEELVHEICDCDPDTALCGEDLGDGEEGPARPEELLCVVCIDLAKLPCERCGA